MMTALLAFVGCDRLQESSSAVRECGQTNFVTVTSVITNMVTITNVVATGSDASHVKTARRTAAYKVSAEGLQAHQLRAILNDAGARVLTCTPGSVALVEVPDGVVNALRIGGVVSLHALEARDKVAGGIGSRVRIIPLSSMDAENLAQAVKALGGTVVARATVSEPAIRAELSLESIGKLAARGDVRRIERDE